MTDRTPEQQAADDAVRAALEQHEAAYRPEWSDLPSVVLTDFVTVAVVRGFMDDGDAGSRLVIGVPDGGNAPAFALVGLLELAKQQIVADFTDRD